MHDIGALQTLANNKVSLSIFIINNYGGAIFDYLPISTQIDSKIFRKFIKNNNYCNFNTIIKSYNLEYEEIKSLLDFKKIDMKKLKVYEVMIDSRNSLKFINKFSTSLK